MTDRPPPRERFDLVDRQIAFWMHHHGHRWERFAIGLLFSWFGLLKVIGEKSATSIIAETVYWGSPEVTSRLLGVWELAIGVCLLVPVLVRVGLLLIAVRLPGTLVALMAKSDICWTDTFGVPTIQGQYLIKDALLFAAAMVIGGTVREEHRHADALH